MTSKKPAGEITAVLHGGPADGGTYVGPVAPRILNVHGHRYARADDPGGTFLGCYVFVAQPRGGVVPEIEPATTQSGRIHLDGIEPVDVVVKSLFHEGGMLR